MRHNNAASIVHKDGSRVGLWSPETTKAPGYRALREEPMKGTRTLELLHGKKSLFRALSAERRCKSALSMRGADSRYAIGSDRIPLESGFKSPPFDRVVRVPDRRVFRVPVTEHAARRGWLTVSVSVSGPVGRTRVVRRVRVTSTPDRNRARTARPSHRLRESTSRRPHSARRPKRSSGPHVPGSQTSLRGGDRTELRHPGAPRQFCGSSGLAVESRVGTRAQRMSATDQPFSGPEPLGESLKRLKLSKTPAGLSCAQQGGKPTGAFISPC